MGFVGDLLGFGGGGMNFNADGTPILQPVDLNQTGAAINRSNMGLDQQQQFLNALRSQNGVQNQSDIFNQQQALANQLQGVANGTGPNPALQQLQNQTGQNVAQQAALMGGQRGANANVGLMARQIAQQGAGIQQNAVGQGAALQAQQQLAGLGALQAQQGMMGQMANQQVGQQAQALMGLNQGSQSQQNSLLGALNQFNTNKVNMQSNINSANSGVQSQTASAQGGLLGGLMGGAGAAFMADGGMVPDHYDCGGMVKHFADGGEADQPQSFAGKFLKGWSQPSQMNTPFSNMGADRNNPGASQLNQGSAMFSKGLMKGISGMFSGGGGASPVMAGDLIPMASRGGKVGGQANVKGDNLKNDTVPAMLSPGEVVIPRSVMQSSDPVKGAANFVAQVMARKGRK